METPPYLIEQYAAEHRVSKMMAKRALYLEGLNTEDRKVAEVARSLGLATSSLKGLARKFLIDFADYRPHSKRRDAGETVSPFRADIHLPAADLPMFASR